MEKKDYQIMPILSNAEYEALKASIKKNGLIIPIEMDEHGNILDGYHRKRACEELGITDIPKTVRKFDTEEEKEVHIIALNLIRRNMSREQIKELRESLRKDMKKRKKVALELRNQGKTQEETAAIVGVTQKTVDNWESGKNDDTDNNDKNDNKDLRVTIPKKEHNEIYERSKKGETQEQIAADYGVSQQRISNIIKIVEAKKNQPEPAETPEFPEKKYKCIVIDPPWPVKKIEREERPNQGESLDYPTMTLEEIEKLPIEKLADESGCHIYLWTTHKFLPDAMELFEKWGVEYQCLLTWGKNTGMTPFSWMYNTEHILFGRIGTLKLLKNGIKLLFNGKVSRHSEKPEEFFDIVKMASPTPRLEMFARKPRDDFDVWGNEA